MQILEAKIVKHWMRVGTYTKKSTGETKERLIPVLMGVRVVIDNAVFFWSAKHNTFSVTYPDKDVFNRSLAKVGTEKGTKYGGMTLNKLRTDFSPKLVELLAKGMEQAAMEDADG